MSNNNERKREVIEIILHPETIEGMEDLFGRCVDETEAFNALEKIRALLIYLQSLEIEGSEERSIKYDFGLEQAISGIEEAQEAVGM